MLCPKIYSVYVEGNYEEDNERWKMKACTDNYNIATMKTIYDVKKEFTDDLLNMCNIAKIRSTKRWSEKMYLFFISDS